MSVAAGLVHKALGAKARLSAFYRFSYRFISRLKPFETIYANFINFIKNILTANKKLKIARYRVNHFRYRLNQMENLINQSNPENYKCGRNLNQLR